jgi:LemA protein
MALWIVLAVLVLLLLFLVLGYNGLVAKRNRAGNAWAQVDVQLRRRHDLIPNLVEAVKGYAAHEQGTFEAVTQARARAESAEGPAATSAAEAQLSGALGRLMAVAESYPALRATENFQQLQAQLAATENKIATARQIYNDTVLTYNNACQQIPTNILAGMFHFEPREFFVLEDGDAAREPVAVKL